MPNNTSSQSLNLQQIKNEIGHVESGGNYGATNSQKGSTATGKYQFIWSKWAPQISEVTGVKSRQAFLNNPQAQEDFMDHYVNHVITPRVSMLRQEGLGQGFSDADLAKFIHLEGGGGAAKKLRNGTLDQATGNNLSPLQYIHHSGLYRHSGSDQEPDENNNKILEDDPQEEAQAPQASIYDQVVNQVHQSTGNQYAQGSLVTDPIDPTFDLPTEPEDHLAPFKASLTPHQWDATDQENLVKSAHGGIKTLSLDSTPAATTSTGSSIEKDSGAPLAGAIGGITSFASGLLQEDQSARTGRVDKGLAVGKGALAGAGAGASIGAAFSPVGAAIGAGVGAVAGGVTGLIGANRQQKVLTGAGIKRGQAQDSAINNRAVTVDNNPYGTQMRNGGYTKYENGGGIFPSFTYEDGSTVQGLPMIPAQAVPQDVAPMQPGQKGQPQGQPQQNMIDIEKGELRIDPKSGKILQEYTGINPKTSTRYQRHNVDPDSEPGANYVHADPGQFIVTVKDAKNFKNADINNDTITKGTIMRNIVHNKNKNEGNYRKGSYVVEPNKYAQGSTVLPKLDPTEDDDPKHPHQLKMFNQLTVAEKNEALPLIKPDYPELLKRLQADPSRHKALPNNFDKMSSEEQQKFLDNSALPNKQPIKNTKQVPQTGNPVSPSALKIAQDKAYNERQSDVTPVNRLTPLDLTNPHGSRPTKINTPAIAEKHYSMGSAPAPSPWNNIGKQIGDYAPSLYNIGQGIMGGDKEGHIASNYNPYEGAMIGNMPTNMNYEPQRQEALRNADAAQQDNNQRTNSSSIGRSNNNNIYSNTQNGLANIQMQNTQYNNTAGEQRSSAYNSMGQQRVAADQYASQYNQGIDNINAQNTGAARNSLGAGMSQMQQTQQNNTKNKTQSDYDHYMLNTILPMWMPAIKNHMELNGMQFPQNPNS